MMNRHTAAPAPARGSSAVAIGTHEQHHHALATAASHIVRRAATANIDDTIGAALSRLRGQTFDDADALHVLDSAGRLQGRIPITGVLAAALDRPVRELMDPDPARVAPDADQERVALLAIARRVASVPVVDGEGTLIGAVPASAMLDVLRREHDEDLHRLAGITVDETRARTALEAPPVRQARARLPWLLVGLVGTMASALLLSRFQRILEAHLSVAFFIPAIVYLADAIGTQTETVVVRGLSVVHMPLAALLRREVLTGLLIGIVLSILMVPAVVVAVADVPLALAVALAVLVAGTLATATGLLLPWMLSRAGRDPAFGSGPVATIVQDILSLVVYVATITLFLR